MLQRLCRRAAGPRRAVLGAAPVLLGARPQRRGFFALFKKQRTTPAATAAEEGDPAALADAAAAAAAVMRGDVDTRTFVRDPHDPTRLTTRHYAIVNESPRWTQSDAHTRQVGVWLEQLYATMRVQLGGREPKPHVRFVPGAMHRPPPGYRPRHDGHDGDDDAPKIRVCIFPDESTFAQLCSAHMRASYNRATMRMGGFTAVDTAASVYTWDHTQPHVGERPVIPFVVPSPAAAAFDPTNTQVPVLAAARALPAPERERWWRACEHATRRVLLHECAHQYHLHCGDAHRSARTSPVPAWYKEGIAERMAHHACAPVVLPATAAGADSASAWPVASVRLMRHPRDLLSYHRHGPATVANAATAEAAASVPDPYFDVLDGSGYWRAAERSGLLTSDTAFGDLFRATELPAEGYGVAWLLVWYLHTHYPNRFARFGSALEYHFTDVLPVWERAFTGLSVPALRAELLKFAELCSQPPSHSPPPASTVTP